MKTKRQNHHKGWKQALSVLLVFALAAGLVLSVPALSGVAYAAPILQDDDDAEGEAPSTTTLPGMVDLEKGSSITLNFQKDEKGEFTIDLKQDETLVDLYLVAPAVSLSGHNVYAYCIDNTMPYYEAAAGFVNGIANWHKEPLTQAPAGYPDHAGANAWLLFYYAPLANRADPPVSDQAGLVEKLAEQYFGAGSAGSAMTLQAPVENAADVSYAAPYRTTIGTAAEGLPAGLYMSVVHGDMEQSDYVVLQPQTDGTAPAASGENVAALGKICTIAYSAEKVYTFRPQLISVPGRQSTAGSVVMDTTQEGDWLYAVQTFVKASSVTRYADLQIQKTLAGTAAGGSPVFVFHVVATDPKGDKVDLGIDEYITLRADGTENGLVSQVITNKIPVGSTVVITEEYSGVGYQFKSAEVTVRWSDEEATGTVPELAKAPTVNAQAHSITIENIPAGSIHLTAPAADPEGEENILPDGTTETAVFTNTPGNTNNGGGTVVNSFTQDANGGWSWTKRTYNAKTGEWANVVPGAGN